MIASLRTPLLGLAVVAAVAEMLLLRIALRLGPVLPWQDAMVPIFSVVQLVGVAALNLAALASVGLLALAATDAARQGPRGALLAAVVAAAVLVNLGLGSLVGLLPDASATAVHGLLTGLAMLTVAALAERPARVRALLGLVAAAQVLALAPATLQSLGWDGSGTAAGPGAGLFIAEGVAVAAALTLPFVGLARPRPAELAAGAAVGLVLAVAGMLQPWGIATVAIWTLGFSYYLPPPLYGLAAASAVAVGLALRRTPGATGLGAGLLLVALAGLKLDVTAWALLGLAGLAVAARPAEAAVVERAVPIEPGGAGPARPERVAAAVPAGKLLGNPAGNPAGELLGSSAARPPGNPLENPAGGPVSNPAGGAAVVEGAGSAAPRLAEGARSATPALPPA